MKSTLSTTPMKRRLVVNSVTTATSAALPPNYLGLLFSRRDFIRGGEMRMEMNFPLVVPFPVFFFFCFRSPSRRNERLSNDPPGLRFSSIRHTQPIGCQTEEEEGHRQSGWLENGWTRLVSFMPVVWPR